MTAPNINVISSEERQSDDRNVENTCLSSSTANAILGDLQQHKNANISHTWDQRKANDVQEAIESADTLQKLRVAELDVLIKRTKPQQEKCGIIITLSGLLKYEKVNKLSKVLGDGTACVVERTVDGVFDLRTLAANVLVRKTCPPSKHILHVVAANAVYPHELKEWESKSTVGKVNLITDEGLSQSVTWFSYLEYSESRQQIEPKCCDAHHLFVNCRVKVCKDGLPGFGISNDGWIKVAQLYPDTISKSLVLDL